MNIVKKAGSYRRLQKTTGDTQIHNASSRSAKAKARKTKTKAKKASTPTLRIPITDAAEFFIRLIQELDCRIMDEMYAIWGWRLADEANIGDKLAWMDEPRENTGNASSWSMFDDLDDIPFDFPDQPLVSKSPGDKRPKRKVAGTKSRNRKGNRTVTTKGGRK